MAISKPIPLHKCAIYGVPYVVYLQIYNINHVFQAVKTPLELCFMYYGCHYTAFGS